MDMVYQKRLRRAANKEDGATVFGYYVDDPEDLVLLNLMKMEKLFH